jgi:FKBP-type peptidyl-prolyl cis-trans isomerase FklB
MKRIAAALLGGGAILCAWAGEEGALKLEANTDKINYSVGFRVGSDLKDQGDTLSPELLVKGIQDAVSGAAPLMTEEQMQSALAELQRKAAVLDQEKRAQALAGLKAEGKAFLAENAKKKGVVTLPSGLQYKVIAAGDGKSPGAADTVTVDYKGTLIDGTAFDSSDKRGEPATFPLQGVIPGWTEALQRMKEGGHWELFVPPELAYGDRGRFAGRTLIFDVKLLKVESAKTNPSAAPTAPGAPAHAEKPAAPTTD